ncbi:ADP-ribosylglycohydrolase family protein [Rudaeicoccus suwonensis]|uniref:ADP-ribosylglycohydrolase n=1 Tax=Rudaeicoccus suwonensis TaxID=657409 RepID=A0A561EC64_9MICO|nr:ADP-ribosylglycohydrolase family protein [Rudaeicoccus suwonensis]TWE13205.1 ADP-ribosylglycohydrolase [Rudaeicoccus suwonensis]
MQLTAAQQDRACGAILGAANGDALGAGYEFGSATLGPAGPQMIGGGLGGFAPGEWTDDTSMTYAVLAPLADGLDVRGGEGLDLVAAGFKAWSDSRPPDIGMQTARVLAASGSTAASMTEVARRLHELTGRSAGNGSLMRTAPVALAYLDDRDALAQAAMAVSSLTHHDPLAGQACVLWSMAIRHAIVHAELDIRVGLPWLDHDAQAYWSGLIEQAEACEPGTFVQNGHVMGAFQAAWSAIVHTAIPSDGPACAHLNDALATAIAIGHDTDTVAAIAGGLLGARWGASAVPAAYRRILHGYPGVRGERLVELAHLASNGGRAGHLGWPMAEQLDYSTWEGAGTLVQHPADAGLWLGGVGALAALPSDVDAVVSLCLVGRSQVPNALESFVFRLIDDPTAGANPNLTFVIEDAARTVAALRDEGKTVFLHCVRAESRTPTVAMAYAMLRGADLESARANVLKVLPSARPNGAFEHALQEIDWHL